ncbi:MAG: exodeoxyribonuclease VII small subunit [Planctomycetaceae bacterium]|nr:exodeoxyribonuclease VII small subunit [Planctomycetaceae bacterium]MCP4462459.1 exodeoxyribonuclease VII small subunit [Planctomycetaceae bacterium]MDG1806868.1 exodeoxyribonuclease VII small subunit [Pirellulaceae bacterium]MDG2105944.1 exodeoxyribonuclease VII small subunit [Pirellulaceae bacterium]
MAKKKAAAKKTEPKFEEALTNLEGIVADLETGNLPLTESIQRYEEGVKLLKQCHSSLDQVRRKIELLTQVNAAGGETTTAFDAEETPQDRPARGKADLAAEVDEDGRLF